MVGWLLTRIRDKRKLMVMETRERQRQRQGGPQMPRTAMKISARKIEAGMKEMGVVIESSEKVNDRRRHVGWLSGA